MKKAFSIIVVMITLLACLTSCTRSVEEQWQEQYDLGVRYLSEGNYEEAIIAFEAAIEIDPKRADAYFGAADAYIGLGDYEEANDILIRGQEQCGEVEGFSGRLDSVLFLQSGEIGIRITDFYFDQDAYLAGNNTEFLVSVTYRCPEAQDCVLRIGSNSEDPDSFTMMDEDYLVTESGIYQFNICVTPAKWENAYFGIYVSLSEANYTETREPLAIDVLYIDVEGNVFSESNMETEYPAQTETLIAEVDNPLMFDVITFLGHSIENLDIGTARALMEQNDLDIYESGFDDDEDETWYISGSNQMFGLGPQITAMQYKTDDYVCIWSVNSALNHSDYEQLRTVRDIYTHDTLDEVLVKLGVTNGAEVADYIKGILGKEYASFDELREKINLIQWPWIDGMSMWISAGGGPVTDNGGFIATTVTIRLSYWDRDSYSYSISFHFGQNSNVEYMYQFVDYLDEMTVHVSQN